LHGDPLTNGGSLTCPLAWFWQGIESYQHRQQGLNGDDSGRRVMPELEILPPVSGGFYSVLHDEAA
jgi:hypothetical protein